MSDEINKRGVAKFRSISHRFSYALIAIITLILTAFAIIAVLINFNRIVAELETKAENYLNIGQISLSNPLWNLDAVTIEGFVESLFLDQSIAFIQVLSEDEAIASRIRSELENQPFSYFEQSPDYVAKDISISHNGENIGTLQLAISRTAIQQEITLNIAGSVALALLIVGAIALISFLISQRYIARPLAQLQQSAARIAGGELDTSIDTGSNDEIGQLAGEFNQMASDLREMIDKIRQKTTAYERFVPTKFLEHLGKDEVEEIRLGDVSREELSVLFSDIRSFTSLSERMSPEENFRFINTYLNYVAPVIERNGGFIDKYVGDAIMALFSGIEQGVADDAVRAAIAMIEQLHLYNTRYRKEGQQAITAGIGINTGTLMLGTVGSEQRMDGTVIGDTVNLASRLERLTRLYEIDIAISSNVLEHLNNQSAFMTREIDTVQVRGKEEPVTIYEVFDSDPEVLREGKIRMLGDYNEAIQLYKARSWADATKLFQEVQHSLNGDRVTALYLERCQLYQQQSPTDSWDAVTVLNDK